MFDSNIKHVFTRHNFSDSWMLWVCRSLLTAPSQVENKSNKSVQLQTQLNIQRCIQRPRGPVDSPVDTLRLTLNGSQDFLVFLVIRICRNLDTC